MVKVVWTKKAFGQLERAVKYIREERGLSHAKIVLDAVLLKTQLLEKNLKIGT